MKYTLESPIDWYREVLIFLASCQTISSSKRFTTGLDMLHFELKYELFNTCNTLIANTSSTFYTLYTLYTFTS